MHFAKLMMPASVRFFTGKRFFSIDQWSMVNGLLFHMTQPTSRNIIKAIACSNPTISEH